MGRTQVIVGAEMRDWLISQQVWREGIYILGDKTYGDGKHYLDVVSDKLEPGFHGVREIVVESGDLRFGTPRLCGRISTDDVFAIPLRNRHDSSGLRPNQGPEPMSTKMDEDDWAHTLAVFRACLPRRERKAEDDRRFLEALHFFTVENVRWRALPERFGHWNSVWKRFDRLSKAGVFEAFFDTLASMSSTAHLIQMFDSTVVRAHVSAAGAKGGKKARRSDIRAAASPRKSTQNRTPPATSSPSI